MTLSSLNTNKLLPATVGWAKINEAASTNWTFTNVTLNGAAGRLGQYTSTTTGNLVVLTAGYVRALLVGGEGGGASNASYTYMTGRSGGDVVSIPQLFLPAGNVPCKCGSAGDAWVSNGNGAGSSGRPTILGSAFACGGGGSGISPGIAPTTGTNSGTYWPQNTTARVGCNGFGTTSPGGNVGGNGVTNDITGSSVYYGGGTDGGGGTPGLGATGAFLYIWVPN